MDVSLVIRHRLTELRMEQRDLAAAAQVTESYISQLLTRKKLPPAPDRTDIYEKMAKFLKLPAGRLSKLADDERKEELKRTLGQPPAPLLKEVRETVPGGSTAAIRLDKVLGEVRLALPMTPIIRRICRGR